ncbi:MAG: hypothetical protein U0528_12860 [Anaerolineae bacterium]
MRSTSAPVPAWVGLQYWFVLEDEQGNTYQTQTWQAEYADDTKSWGRAGRGHHRVLGASDPDSFGQLALDAMKEQREFYRAAWGSLLSYKRARDLLRHQAELLRVGLEFRNCRAE